jgi:hypothetical protein
MKKLTTLFAIVALTTTLGLAGCKKKGNAQEGKDDTAAKPMDNTGDMKKDDKGAAPAAGGDMKKDDKGAAPAAGGGDLPAECNDYKAAIEKLASCDKMPQQARDALKQAYDQASAGWANLPAESKAGLATACKAGADAVMQSAKATCGW